MKVRSMARRATPLVSMGMGIAMTATTALVALTAQPAGAAVGYPGLWDTACITTPTARFAPAPDGLVRGFLETGCKGDTIDFVSIDPGHGNGGVLHQVTPYKGIVLATAQDGQGTYLLYRATDGVRLAKVLRDRRMQASQLLSKATGGGLEGSIAASGTGWYAVWSEPKASGGFGLHAAASAQYAIAPSAQAIPAGAGVDDSAPVIARIGARKINYLLAFARHTHSGYHLMVAHRGQPWATPKELDNGTENPQPAITRADVNTYVAWLHGRTIRLATTIGEHGWQTALHEVALPQAPGTNPVSAPQVAYTCGRLYVAYESGTENRGTIYVDTLFRGKWVRHTVRVDKTSAPVLVGIAAHCSSGAVMWTEAGMLRGAMVS